MNRRAFIKDSGVIVCGCAVGASLLQSCSALKSAVIQARREGDFLVFASSEMEGKRYIVINHADLEFPIYVKGRDGEYSAVLLKCSHKGCELDPGTSVLTCPCHGGTFKPTGEVIQRPATQPLERFEVTESDGELRIKLM